MRYYATIDAVVKRLKYSAESQADCYRERERERERERQRRLQRLDELTQRNVICVSVQTSGAPFVSDITAHSIKALARAIGKMRVCGLLVLLCHRGRAVCRCVPTGALCVCVCLCRGYRGNAWLDIHLFKLVD